MMRSWAATGSLMALSLVLSGSTAVAGAPAYGRDLLRLGDPVRGRPLFPPEIVLASDPGCPEDLTVAPSHRSGGYLVAWTVASPVCATLTPGVTIAHQVRGRVVAADGTPGPTFAIVSKGQTTGPAIAYNPELGEFLLVYSECKGAHCAIAAQRLTEDGDLSGAPVAVTAADTVLQVPAVAFNGRQGQYLVAWGRALDGHADRIEGRVLAIDGTPLDAPFAVSRSYLDLRVVFHRPRVAASDADGTWLVAWSLDQLVTAEGGPVCMPAGEVCDVVGAVVTPATVLSGTPGLLVGERALLSGTEAAGHVGPALAWDPVRDRWLVVATRIDSEGPFGLEGRFLLGPAALAEDEPFPIGLLTPSPFFPVSLQYDGACGRDGYLVALNEVTEFHEDLGPRGAWLESDGTRRGFPVSLSVDHTFATGLAVTLQPFVCAWPRGLAVLTRLAGGVLEVVGRLLP